jgi:hypothetical protein
MQREPSSRRAWSWLVAAAVAVGVCFASMRPAQGGDPSDDGVPRGAVAFFGAGAMCPFGWLPADMVTGRMVVGVNDGTAVGRSVGTPLRDREDRTHTHALSATISVPSRSIAGANGTNRQGAAAGDQRVTGTTGAASSGLPFVQLRACVKQ